MEEKQDPNIEKFNAFLEETKKKFDEYFAHLGYVCFIFNKEKHQGESVYITNSPKDVAPIVEPYANANSIEEARQKKIKLRQLRRAK